MLRFLNFLQGFDDLDHNETTTTGTFGDLDGNDPDAETPTPWQGEGGHQKPPFNRRAIVFALSALLIITTSFLIYNLLPLIMAYVRRKIPVSKKRIARRYRTIEQWIVTKTVHPHDHACIALKRMEQTRLEKESSPPLEQTGSWQSECSKTHTDLKESPKRSHTDVTDHSESERECAICLEPFVVGTKASWSINETCQHVFHPQCIKDWLLRNTECPYCRRLFMPVDCTTQRLSQSILKEMAKERKRRWMTTYYCEQDGLCVAGPFDIKPIHDDKSTKKKGKSEILSKEKNAEQDDCVTILIEEHGETEGSHTGDSSTLESTDEETSAENEDSQQSSVLPKELESNSSSLHGSIDNPSLSGDAASIHGLQKGCALDLDLELGGETEPVILMKETLQSGNDQVCRRDDPSECRDEANDFRQDDEEDQRTEAPQTIDAELGVGRE